MTKPNCYDCRHRRSLPGESHSACHHPATRSMHEGGGLLDLVAVLGKRSGFSSVEPSAEARALNVTGDRGAQARGWFLWPVNYDPVWLRSCDGFEASAKGAQGK